MDGRPSDWLPESPTRSPAWRFLRAAGLNAGSFAANRVVDDAGVARLRRLLGQLADTNARRQRARPADREALRLWRADEPTERWLLEARLLTGEPIAAVAAACGVSEDVVSAYHELFFDVRGRLKARDWVLIQAVGSGPWNEFFGPQPGGLWKYTGYFGGPLVLEAVVAATAQGLSASWLQAASGESAAAAAALRLRVRLTLAGLAARSPSQLGALAALRNGLDRLAVDLGRSRTPDPVARLMLRSLRVFGGPAAATPVRTSSKDCPAVAPGPRHERHRHKEVTDVREEKRTGKVVTTATARRGADGPAGAGAPRPVPTADREGPAQGLQGGPVSGRPLQRARATKSGGKLDSNAEGQPAAPKNPRRVAAGKANWAKRRGFTAAGRERLRLAALQHRPWRFSTGPRTDVGKARAAQNGKYRQCGPVSVRSLKAELAGLRAVVEGTRAAGRLAARDVGGDN